MLTGILLHQGGLPSKQVEQQTVEQQTGGGGLGDLNVLWGGSQREAAQW